MAHNYARIICVVISSVHYISMTVSRSRPNKKSTLCPTYASDSSLLSEINIDSVTYHWSSKQFSAAFPWSIYRLKAIMLKGILKYKHGTCQEMHVSCCSLVNLTVVFECCYTTHAILVISQWRQGISFQRPIESVYGITAKKKSRLLISDTLWWNLWFSNGHIDKYIIQVGWEH